MNSTGKERDQSDVFVVIFFLGGAEKFLFVVILEIGKAKFLPS